MENSNQTLNDRYEHLLRRACGLLDRATFNFPQEGRECNAVVANIKKALTDATAQKNSDSYFKRLATVGDKPGAKPSDTLIGKSLFKELNECLEFIRSYHKDPSDEFQMKYRQIGYSQSHLHEMILRSIEIVRLLQIEPVLSSEIPVITDEHAAEIEARWSSATWEEKLAWHNNIGSRRGRLAAHYDELLVIANHFANASQEREQGEIRDDAWLEERRLLDAPNTVQQERESGEAMQIAKSALQYAAKVFREYEQIHAAKPDLVKADRNCTHAKVCEAALSKIEVQEGGNG